MRRWHDCPEPLYAASLNLAGKPDYLIHKWNYVLPVEVKSSPAPAEPHRSHVMQLAAYCYLVHESTGRRPPYAVLAYADRTFAIPYTRSLERELEDTIAWMREDLGAGQAARNHNDPARCRSCSYAPYCDQQLS
jgi:CRISPR-associated exonuclease Cas4